jgi:hypothetical protein
VTEKRVQRRHQEDHSTVIPFVSLEKILFSQTQVQVQVLWSTVMTERRVYRSHKEEYGTVFPLVSLYDFRSV